uniref:Opsin n=1 Tax=Renilla koellikeri TaxID=6135 RepID=A0A346FU12_RENKO|nr:opsin [Renilla koellikeri]
MSSERQPPINNFSSSINIVLATVHIVYVVLGVFPNALVFFVMIKAKKLRQEPKNIILLVRTFVDGLQSATICPLPIAASFAGKWTAGYHGCIGYAFFTSWFGLTSILLNALMVYERYFTLSKVPPRSLSHVFTYACIGACYLAGFIVSCFPLLGWSSYGYEAMGYHCSVVWYSTDWIHASFTIFLMVFFYAVPVTIILVAGCGVVRSVHRLHGVVKQISGTSSSISKAVFTTQVKATRLVAIMVAGFLIAWTPYGAFAVYAMTNENPPMLVATLPSTFAKSSLVYNPLIYLFMYRKLRRGSIDLMQNIASELFGTTDSSTGVKHTARLNSNRVGVQLISTTTPLPGTSSAFDDPTRN